MSIHLLHINGIYKESEVFNYDEEQKIHNI